MQLTTQMQAEMYDIAKRVDDIAAKIVAPVLTDVGRNPGGSLWYDPIEYLSTHLEEFSAFKVRLENLLCETERKEFVHENHDRTPFFTLKISVIIAYWVEQSLLRVAKSSKRKVISGKVTDCTMQYGS